MRTIGFVVLEILAENGHVLGNRADYEVQTDIYREFDDAEKILTGMCVEYPESRFQVAEITVRD